VAEVSKILVVVMNHGWQSESTDGPKGGWSCFFGVVAMVAVVTSPQLLDLSICLSIYLSICLSVYLSTCLSVYLSASLKTKLFCETSAVVDLGSIKKETGLQEFRSFST